MADQPVMKFAEVGLLASDVEAISIKAGALLLLLALVHAGITIEWRQINGVQSIVLPIRTTLLLLAGVWLIGFGLSLS